MSLSFASVFSGFGSVFQRVPQPLPEGFIGNFINNSIQKGKRLHENKKKSKNFSANGFRRADDVGRVDFAKKKGWSCLGCWISGPDMSILLGSFFGFRDWACLSVYSLFCFSFSFASLSFSTSASSSAPAWFASSSALLLQAKTYA